jgi:Tol biopolymer transport system component
MPDGSPLERSGREDPALSGDGRILASVVERGGRSTLLLQEQASGRLLRLRHLRRHQPHTSPSLSWTGRYVAALVQRGSRRVAVIEDRLSGRLHRLPLPGDREPERLSLSPDARRLALEVVQGGRHRVQVVELGGLLEPDLPRGTAAVGADRP